MSDFEHIFEENITIQYWLKIYEIACYSREFEDKEAIRELLFDNIENENEQKILESLIQELDNINN